MATQRDHPAVKTRGQAVSVPGEDGGLPPGGGQLQDQPL